MARVPPTPVVLSLYALPLSVVIPPRIPAPRPHGGFPELRVAVCLHDQHPEVTPVYDDVGNLTGWRGSYSEVFDRDPNGSGWRSSSVQINFEGHRVASKVAGRREFKRFLTRKFATLLHVKNWVES